MKGISKSLHFPLMLLKVAGMYETTKSARLTIAATVYNSILACIIILVFLQFFNVKGNVFRFVNNMEAFCAFTQHMGKVFFLLYNQDTLHLLIEATKTFKSFAQCSSKMRKNLKSLQNGHLLLQKIFFLGIATCVTVIIMFTLSGTGLPLGSWNMENRGYLYSILLILEVIILMPMTFALSAVDIIFLAFCVEIILQFRVLSCSLEKLDILEAECDNKLKLYINQHIFLLRLLKDVAELYSPLLAVEYLTIAPLLCSEMYVVCESNDFKTLVKYALLCVALIIEFSFFCIPADYVATEATEFANSLYSCLWYTKFESKIWKTLPFAIQRSQLVTTFTAGGFVGIDIRTVLVVVKLAWSSCAVMRAMKK